MNQMNSVQILTQFPSDQFQLFPHIHDTVTQVPASIHIFDNNFEFLVYAHMILLDLIILITRGEEYKLLSRFRVTIDGVRIGV
jgi:hypothetical protein